MVLEALKYIDEAVIALAMVMLLMPFWAGARFSEPHPVGRVERWLLLLGSAMSLLATVYLVYDATHGRAAGAQSGELLFYIAPTAFCAGMLVLTRHRSRPIVEALTALILSLQLVFVLSGYGYFFVLSGATILAACIVGLRLREKPFE